MTTHRRRSIEIAEPDFIPTRKELDMLRPANYLSGTKGVATALIVLLGLISFVTVYQVSAQQLIPETHQTPLVQSAPDLLEAPSPEKNALHPAPQPLAPPGSDVATSDPLFEELKQAFLSQTRTSANTNATSSSVQHGDGIWHAAETLLRAARMLELEEKRLRDQGDVAKARMIRQSINTIRGQVVTLLSWSPD